MRSLRLIPIIYLLTSCETREIKHSGLNDLVVGVDQVVLYVNGDFYFELGLGGHDGTYKIQGDTVYLKFEEKDVQFLPKKLLMTNKYFITIYPDSTIHQTKIDRHL